MTNHIRTSGNSLLVVILLLGLLLTMALGGNILIRNNSALQRDMIRGHQAYYNGEAGIEMALYILKDHLPGFEFTDGEAILTPSPTLKNFPYYKDPLTQKTTFRVLGKTNQLPADIGDLKSRPLELPPQEPISIALFTEEGTAGTPKVKDFEGNFILEYASPTVGSPCIRWDITGFTDEFVSESVGGVFNCGAIGWNSPKRSASLTGFYKADKDGAPIIKDLPISTFLREHNQNYLTLTNLYTEGTINATFRTENSADLIARPQSSVQSEGYVCSSTDTNTCFIQQALEIQIRQGQILPIFSFTLFQ